MKKIIYFISVFLTAISYGQVGIGTTSPNTSSTLDVTTLLKEC